MRLASVVGIWRKTFGISILGGRFLFKEQETVVRRAVWSPEDEGLAVKTLSFISEENLEMDSIDISLTNWCSM